jgi:immune inhibitor A
MSRLAIKFENNRKFIPSTRNPKGETRNKPTDYTLELLNNDSPHLVPPSPEAAKKIRQQMEKLRKSKTLSLANLVTVRERSSPGLNDGLIYPGDTFALGTTATVAKSAAAQLSPPQGTVRIIVVLVQFSDKTMTHNKKHFEDLLFSNGVVSTGSMREYWKEVTNGGLDIVGEVVGPYTLPKTLAEYAHGESGLGSISPNARTMAQDAAITADPTVDFSKYDNNGDGYIDVFMIVHAGADAAKTLNKNDIWSHKWILPSVYNAEGKKIYAYDTVAEDAQIGVCAHELGHLLFGFIDLYDTDLSSSGVGNWCLMAGGSWNNSGKTPAHPCAWLKNQQGWATTITPKTNGPIDIKAVETGHTIYKLWKNGSPGKEYFLVENRQKTLFDRNLPGAGLLIWHIDEAIGTNSNENHPKVALEQADAKNDLESGRDRGDVGDPFPGSTSNTTFCYGSNPNSKSYGDVDTEVCVENIPSSGATMKVDIKFKPGSEPPPRPRFWL